MTPLFSSQSREEDPWPAAPCPSPRPNDSPARQRSARPRDALKPAAGTPPRNRGSVLPSVPGHPYDPRPPWFGHSHGGFVAQQFALDHPEQLAALVLYDTSPVADDQFWAAAASSMEQFVSDRADDHPETAGYVEALTTRLELLDDDGTTAVLRTMMLAYVFDYWGREAEFAPARRSMRMYAAATRGEGPPFDVRDELPDISTPTLVLAGRQDLICGPRWAALLHEAIPAAELTILESTGHLAHVERPGQFAAVVGAFLEARGVLNGQRTP
ncbi:alpha/beta fold hydrolase [Streptomyces sp. NPDC001414]